MEDENLSPEKREKLEKALMLFLDHVRATVDCTLEDDLDESECYYIAQELLAGKWNHVEKSFGVFFERMDEYCGGYPENYYGMFTSLEGGCKPLAILRERVEFDYDENKKIREARVYYELVEKWF